MNAEISMKTRIAKNERMRRMQRIQRKQGMLKPPLMP